MRVPWGLTRFRVKVAWGHYLSSQPGDSAKGTAALGRSAKTSAISKGPRAREGWVSRVQGKRSGQQHKRYLGSNPSVAVF